MDTFHYGHMDISLGYCQKRLQTFDLKFNIILLILLLMFHLLIATKDQIDF